MGFASTLNPNLKALNPEPKSYTVHAHVQGSRVQGFWGEGLPVHGVKVLLVLQVGVSDIQLISIYIYKYVCMYIYICKCNYVCIYICTCIQDLYTYQTDIYVYVYTPLYVCTYTHTYRDFFASLTQHRRRPGLCCSCIHAP